jgi:hypothetical protein
VQLAIISFNKSAVQLVIAGFNKNRTEIKSIIFFLRNRAINAFGTTVRKFPDFVRMTPFQLALTPFLRRFYLRHVHARPNLTHSDSPVVLDTSIDLSLSLNTLQPNAQTSYHQLAICPSPFDYFHSFASFHLSP